MTGHSRLVAVQTVVVGVLLVVVFATLLQPESESPLSGVEAPAGPRGSAPGPDVSGGDDDEPGDGSGQPAGSGDPDGPVTAGGDAGDNGGGGVLGTGSAGAQGALTPAPPPPLPQTDPDDRTDGDAGTPSDDQYGDTLTRLTERLN